jgi:hypothetical protein
MTVPVSARLRGGTSRLEPMLLGRITQGSYRHRALLFKYLCDLEGINLPCRLMRSKDEKGSELRVWNTIPVAPGVDGATNVWSVIAL